MTTEQTSSITVSVHSQQLHPFSFYSDGVSSPFSHFNFIAAHFGGEIFTHETDSKHSGGAATMLLPVIHHCRLGILRRGAYRRR